jgi:WD40 repeat protein
MTLTSRSLAPGGNESHSFLTHRFRGFNISNMNTTDTSEILTPIRRLQLADRPYITSVSDNGKRIAVCSQSGRCCLFDEDLRQLYETDFGAGVDWVQLNESGSLLLVGFRSHIEGYTTAGNITPVLKLAAPGTSDPCAFVSDEQVLCVATWDRKPMLTAWDIKSSTVIHETSLPARGGAGYVLVPHPEGEAMAAVAYSGQSEEWMFWAHYARGLLRVFSQPEIEDVSLPRFHPTGQELVSHHETLGLCRVRFPSGEFIASVEPEQAFPDSPDDRFSYDIHFFRDDRLLVWQCNLALYEFDLATLRPTATLLTGVEGMTFGEDRFFSEGSWPLADGRLLTSDSHHDKKFKHGTYTLRLWDASKLCGQVSKPDPTRPFTRELISG